MSRWFRFYDDAVNDPKLLRLPDDLYRSWTILLCFASKGDGILPPTDDIALALRLKPSKVAEWITKLVKGGLIDDIGGGRFEPHNWNGRQYKSDVSTERVKRFRKRERNVSSAVSETPPETEQIQSRADTDARTDLQKQVGDFRQAIVQAFAEAKSPNLPETSRAELWISQGFQEDICLAVIAGIVSRKPSINNLSYFDGPIAEAHTKKAPPRKAIGGPGPLDWDAVLDSYKRFGKWSRDAGNDPTSPSCRAPPEILRKYGFEPVADLKRGIGP